MNSCSKCRQHYPAMSKPSALTQHPSIKTVAVKGAVVKHIGWAQLVPVPRVQSRACSTTPQLSPYTSLLRTAR